MTVNYFQQANQQLKAGELKQAIASYQKAIEKNPNFAWYYQNLADALAQDGQIERAIANYEKAIALKTDSAWSYYKLGKLLLERKQTEQAIKHLQKAIDIQDDVADFYVVLGEALSANDLWQEATDAYQRARQMNPYINLPDQYLGELLYKQGKLTEAINVYQQAIEANPQDWQKYQQLGKILQEAGRPTEALSLYQEALKLNPDIAEIYEHLGNIYSSQKDWQIAIDYYQQAIKFNPQDVNVYQQLGEAWGKLQKWDEAVKCYEKGLQVAPQSVEIYESLAKVATQQQQWSIVIDAYQQIIKLNPQSAKFHHQLGYVFAKQKKWQEAIKEYEKAIELNPDSAIIYQQLGDILEKLGSSKDLAKAYQYYCQALELDPNDAVSGKKILNLKPDLDNSDDIDLYWRIGKALVSNKKSSEAIGIYKKIQKLLPENFENTVKLGDAFLQANALEEAIAYYEKALEINPKASEVQHQLGEPLQRLGKLEEAAESYRKAINLNPEYFGSYHNLGDLLKTQGKLQESIAIYQQAIKLNNDDFHWTYHNLADALEKAGDLESAIGAYQKSLEISPDFALAHHKLALILAKQGQLKEAVNHYIEAARLEPQNFQQNSQAIQDTLIKPHTITSDEPYQQWLAKNAPRKFDLKEKAKVVNFFNYQPLISIIMPVFNTPAEFLREVIDSVLDQVYPHWELCIADDASTASHVKQILEEYVEQDDRIKVLYRKDNGHISVSSNSALELAKGDFIALLDHDDLLTPDALYEVVFLLNKHQDADMIYSDEDKINQQGIFIHPYFKPDWSPESFLSRMYTCHLGVYRRSLIEEIGGFRIGYEGAQDWDLVLRFTEKTDKIYHIPKVLYHWRVHPGSTAMAHSNAKIYAYEAGQKAIQDALDRRGEPGQVYPVENLHGHYLVRYKIKEYKKVSIIIPTRDLGNVLDQCLESIFTKTIYPNYEVIIVDNGSMEKETFEVFDKWQNLQPDNFHCFPLDVPFNFSQLSNYGAKKATGDYLLFLNNDTEVITVDWIDAMVEQAQRPGIGAVGVALLYPDQTIQHAGVVMGLGGLAGHIHYQQKSDIAGYFGNFIGLNNVAAVTGACLMCRQEIFEEVGGFDEEDLKIAYNDVDLCLKFLDAGYRNLFLPHVKLYHHESKSRGYEDNPQKKARLKQEADVIKQRWQKYIDHDPFYSPNLTRMAADFRLNLED